MTNQMPAAAGATVECMGGIDCGKPLLLGEERTSGQHLAGCRGRVYVFSDETKVRVKCIGCRQCEPKNVQYVSNSARQGICQGRGWNASMDLAGWMKVPSTLGFVRVGFVRRLGKVECRLFHDIYGPEKWDYSGGGDEELDALVSALACALEARGARLLESTTGEGGAL